MQRNSHHARMAYLLLGVAAMRHGAFPFFLSTFVLTMACGAGGDQSDAGTDAGQDALAEVADDAADASIPYPAPHAPFPTIVSMGGPVLATPHVLPVTFEGDALAQTIGQFTKALHGSSYWSATTSEYGIGDLAVADPVVVPASDTTLPPLSTVTDTQIKAFVVAHLDGTHAGWGTPDAGTVYTLFYPPSVTITKPNETSCTSFGGYHSEVVVGSTKVAYAVIPRCTVFGSLTGTDVITAAASHEIIEAVTDPFGATAPAFTKPDDDHLVYAIRPGSELGDMCANDFDAFIKADVGFTVQRSWSNKLALAGGAPCAPVPDNDVYYAASATPTDSMNIDFTSIDEGVLPTRGVIVPVGQSKTIDIDVFSTGTTNTLNLLAFDEPSAHQKPAELTFAFDQASGKNGDKRKLTITRVANGATFGGTAFVVIAYTDLAHRHEWVVFAGQ